MITAFSAADLFDLSKTGIAAIFDDGPAWTVFPRLEKEIALYAKSLGGDYTEVRPGVWIHTSVSVPDSAVIEGPAVICENAELRPGCYIRGAVVVGAGAVVGNSTEVKNSVLFEGVQVPHYNYVGDSILGAYSHLGAGAIISNLRLDKKNVTVLYKGERHETGLRKFGALVGDGAQIGCNSVLNPGTIIMKNAVVYPLVNAGGVVGEGQTVKTSGENRI